MKCANSTGSQQSHDVSPFYAPPITTIEFDRELVLRIRNGKYSDGMTGANLWKASRILARYLFEHPDQIRGRREVELGCGLALL